MLWCGGQWLTCRLRWTGRRTCACTFRWRTERTGKQDFVQTRYHSAKLAWFPTVWQKGKHV